MSSDRPPTVPLRRKIMAILVGTAPFWMVPVVILRLDRSTAEVLGGIGMAQVAITGVIFCVDVYRNGRWPTQ